MAVFFPMHDDTQVARVYEMKKALTDGMFPVRWVSDLGYGYGYPIFNFYAPLAYYTGAKFMFLGFNALAATKLMIGFGILLAGLFMYFFAREFWGEEGGIISGILYLYAPYHALDVYVRGDIAEVWAYAFIPLAFFGIYKVYLSLQGYIALNPKNKKQKTQNSQLKLKTKKLIWIWITLSSIAYAGVILSHNLTAMMVSPAIFIFAAILYISHRLEDDIYRPHYILLGLLLGVALAAFYWFPVFPEIKYTNVLSVVGGGSDYKDHFVCLKQIWSSPWGYGGSVPGCIDGLSFGIGKLHILLSALSLLALITSYKKNKARFAILLFFSMSLLFSVFLMCKDSKFIWDAIPHMAFFQFPWRFLLLVSFFTSFLGGSIIIYMEKIKNRWVYIVTPLIIVVMIIVYNAKVFVPQRITQLSVSDYTSKHTLNWTVSKISDEYMPKGFAKPLYPGAIYKNKINENKNFKLISLQEKTQDILVDVDVKNTTDIFVNLAYFPGWHVYIDGSQVYFKYSSAGIIIPIKKGRHHIEIKFSQTPIEKTGNIISIAGVFILVLGIITQKKYHV